MQVIKRDGRKEDVSFDKVLKRLQLLAGGKHKNGERFSADLKVDVIPVCQKVISMIKNGITTTELDEFAASTCANLVKIHPDYAHLATRITISNHHKNTLNFVATMKLLYQNKDKQGKPAPLLNNRTYKTIIENAEKLTAMIDINRDFLIDYFGFSTLERSYFLKSKNGHQTIQEQPQHMYMRVAVGLHGTDLEAVKETYDLLSLQKLSQASPTLFNCGTPHMQLSSCFLLGVDDNLMGIYDTLKKTALISKYAGGIGLWAHRIRAAGSTIRGTNGNSDGIIPMLRVFNETARYVNQGGKRKGSIAIYLEPHHADIEDFLDMKKTHGNMNRRCLDLFPAMWISDLFMKRLDQSLSNNEDPTVMWSLFCPDECPNLENLFGDAYEKLYLQYEQERLYRSQIPIIQLWKKILDSQMETGIPYILYKDAANYRNAQMNIGTIKSSNLCAEILLVNDPKDETISVCNLAAVPLGSFIKYTQPTTENQSAQPTDQPAETQQPEKGQPYFDFEDLGNSVRVAIQNLDKIIDLNFYPVDDCKKSNLRERPVGLGVAGLYDAFVKMRLPFESDQAKQLNKDIFECMYYHACKTSLELAKKNGPYQSFKGSPASKGILQFDLWNEDRKRFGQTPTTLNPKYNWDQLKQEIMEHGLRNSTLIALMPTASTAQIVGQTESFECMTYNLYKRQVLSGDFKLINHYLQKDLIDRNLWSEELAEKLIANRGSVLGFSDEEIPADLKQLYKGAFEISQKKYLDLAIERSPFIDQTQSLNIFVKDPSYTVLSTIQMYAFKNRLKTGQYYLRREAKAQAAQFTIRPVKRGVRLLEKLETKREQKSRDEAKTDPTNEPTEPSEQPEEEEVETKFDGPACSRDNPDCLACQV